MSASVFGKQTVWEVTRDKEGQREFMVHHNVETTSVLDGPSIVLNAAGLPAIGSIWNFDNDLDSWAFCTPEATVKRLGQKQGETGFWWDVAQKFSTIPVDRCTDFEIEDPILEPDKIGGSFVKYTKEITKDRWGNAVKSSSHEMFRGPQVEFDANRPTVWIEQNVSLLGLAVFTDMVDKVNDRTLWGLEKRKIKLSNATWSRHYYAGCSIYYTRRFEFDIDFTTFDRVIYDEGTKVLDGKWNVDTGIWDTTLGPRFGGTGIEPDFNNPSHFNRYKDMNGENTRVMLNCFGVPLNTTLPDDTGTGTGTGEDDPCEIPIEYYQERNFLLLGITDTL